MPFGRTDGALLDFDESPPREQSPLPGNEWFSSTAAAEEKKVPKVNRKKGKKAGKASIRRVVDESSPPEALDPIIDLELSPPSSLPKDTALEDLAYESFPVQGLPPSRKRIPHEEDTPESLMLDIGEPVAEVQHPESGHRQNINQPSSFAFGNSIHEPITGPENDAEFEDGAIPQRPPIPTTSQAPEAPGPPMQPVTKRRVSMDNPNTPAIPVPNIRQQLPTLGQPRAYIQSMMMRDFSDVRTRDGAKVAGTDGYCCVFDSFSDAADRGSSKRARDALIVGSEGGLDVYRVLPNKIEVAGHLEGLRGSVICAKVLPHSELTDALQMLRPLIAVVVHGPVSGNKTIQDQHNADRNEREVQYQTTVEVYSLRKQEHVTTLLETQIISVKPPAIGQPSPLPAPIGDLRLDAKGRFVTISSGSSGEIFVFSALSHTLHDSPQFRCIGKFWTSVQTPLDPLNPPNSRDGPHHTSDASDRAHATIMSLSARWLALVSPASSQRTSILARPLVSKQNAIPVGLNNHTPPTPPPVTCDVVGVGEEGTWGRLTRQAAQGIVKYSQKGIEFGWQGWRELTNPTNPSGSQNEHARTPSSEHDQFPPTNAPLDEPGRIGYEPAIVTIIDLQAVLQAEDLKAKHVPPPLATFALTEGCNYLSFSTSGLRLLTVSRRGEMSTVWDLTGACHGSTTRRAGYDARSPGPCIKQVLRIPRSSQCVVVDASWSRSDDMLALVTTHGTVHLHEVLERASSPRRMRRFTGDDISDRPLAVTGMPIGLSPPSANGFLGSLRTSWQQVSSGVGAIRTNNGSNTFALPTTFAGFKEATAFASHAGSRMVARSLHQGYTAAKGGASDYWHADDNKIRHKALADNPRLGTVRWMPRQSDVLLGVVCGGIVHLYSIARTTRQKGEHLVTGLKPEKGTKHFTLPSIVTKDDGRLNSDGRHCIDIGPHGYWALHYRDEDSGDSSHGTTIRHRISPQQQDHYAPLLTDVETNPPYCPFHIDSRISIYTFDGEPAQSAFLLPPPKTSRKQQIIHRRHNNGSNNNNNNDHDHDPDNEKWVFGGPLPPSTKVNSHDDDHDHDDDFLHHTHSHPLAQEGQQPRRHLDYLPDSDDELAAQVESRLTMRTTISDEGNSVLRAGAGGGEEGSGGDANHPDGDNDHKEEDYDEW